MLWTLISSAFRALGRAARRTPKVYGPGKKKKAGKPIYDKYGHQVYEEAALSRAASRAVSTAYQAGWAMEAVKGFASDWFPQASVGITVRIWGDPLSNTKQLLYLAIAIASNNQENVFSQAALAFQINTGIFSAVIVPHEQFVQVQIAYKAGGLLGNVTTAFAQVMTTDQGTPNNFFAVNRWPSLMRFTVGPVYGPSLLTDQNGNKVDNNAFLELEAAHDKNSHLSQNAPNPTGPIDNPVPAFDLKSRTDDFTALLVAAFTPACDSTGQYTNNRPVIQYVKGVYGSTLKVPGSSVTINQRQ